VRDRTHSFKIKSEVYPLLNPNCKECQALWTRYASATADHIRKEGNLRIAALRYDRERVVILTREAESSKQLRIAGHEAIRLHEKEAHSEKGVA
jgi:hypothetical protein